MNLLFALTAYPPSVGGAQLHTHMLARCLSRRHHVGVVTQWDTNRHDWLIGSTLAAPFVSRDYIVDSVHVHRFGLSVRDKILLAPFVLAYFPLRFIALPMIAGSLEKHLAPYAMTADLVHNVRIGREALSYSAFRAARRADIPFVVTPVHHPRWRGYPYSAFIRLYQMADLVFALTGAERDQLASLGVPDDRITVTGIGPVLSPEAFPQAFLEKHGIEGPAVLFIGQFYRYKGFLEVLGAAPIVWKRIPEAHFVFIGPPVRGSEGFFERIVDRRIHYLGIVDLQEKTNALAACALLCVPSTQESFGGVFTEAWSFSKPVVGCAIAAVSEVVSHGEDGLLVPQEPKYIADAICQLLCDPTLARSMGQAGKRKVLDQYTWERLASLTEQAYLSLLRG